MNNKILLFVAIFSFGYVANDVLRENNINLINKANADVAGMNHRELRRDRDFKKAVRHIVERCSVTSSGISC